MASPDGPRRAPRPRSTRTSRGSRRTSPTAEAIEAVFNQIAAEGGAEIVIHLAAYYDFTGEEHPEYYRTNVQGLRNILDLSGLVGTRHFIFSSSVAASAFPRPRPP